MKNNKQNCQLLKFQRQNKGALDILQLENYQNIEKCKQELDKFKTSNQYVLQKLEVQLEEDSSDEELYQQQEMREVEKTQNSNQSCNFEQQSCDLPVIKLEENVSQIKLPQKFDLKFKKNNGQIGLEQFSQWFQEDYLKKLQQLENQDLSEEQFQSSYISQQQKYNTNYKIAKQSKNKAQQNQSSPSQVTFPQKQLNANKEELQQFPQSTRSEQIMTHEQLEERLDSIRKTVLTGRIFKKQKYWKNENFQQSQQNNTYESFDKES